MLTEILFDHSCTAKLSMDHTDSTVPGRTNVKVVFGFQAIQVGEMCKSLMLYVMCKHINKAAKML